VDFPPISVMYDGEEYWLYDGFHRLRAAEKVGRSEIEADVEQGTKEDAQWASLAANKQHGLRRSQADKERAITRALKGWYEEKSQREIARHVGVSNSTVSRKCEEVFDSNTSSQKDKRGRGGRVQGKDGNWYPSSHDSTDKPLDAAQEESEMQPEGGTEGSPYDPDTRGDGAPRERSDPSSSLGAPSGEHSAGKSTEEYVDAHEAVRRICVQLSSITEDGSRLDAGIQELIERAQQDELPAREIDKLRSELESVARWFLSRARNLHPNPGSDRLYNYD